MKKKSWLFLSLVLALALLGGCTKKPAPTPTPSPAPTESATPTPVPTPDARPKVNLAMLKGPTGMGAAKLMAENDQGKSVNDYTFTVAAAPDELVGKLVKGEVDIAALPTNLASSLFHKTEGGVQMIALNTLGVLYLVENGETVQSMGDLAGRTIYATGQGANPEYVLNYLLRENGLEPGGDVTIEWKTSDELTALVASGEAPLAMLPVPAVTGALLKNKDLRVALDLTKEWDAVTEDGTLTMGCVVVRTEFAQAHPKIVEDFLAEYAASIDYVKTNLEDAAALIAQYGITPNAAVAKAAIPQANLVAITGRSDIQFNLQSYYEVLFAADPKSIGGSIPDDSFYYAP